MGEIWQAVAWLRSAAGNEGLGLCTQNVLWCDERIFSANSESAGSALMFAVSPSSTVQRPRCDNHAD